MSAFYRDSNQNEPDLLVTSPTSVDAIEVNYDIARILSMMV